VREALPRGAVIAIRALKHRVPAGASPEAAELAGEALETVVEVMRGNVRKLTRERLTAAAMLREEMCGPVPKKHEHTGPDGGPVSISINGIVKT